MFVSARVADGSLSSRSKLFRSVLGHVSDPVQYTPRLVNGRKLGGGGHDIPIAALAAQSRL